MSTRMIAASLAITTLGGCGSPEPATDTRAITDGSGTVVATVPDRAPSDAGRIACARDDGDFTEGCTVERTADATGTILTVRDAEGGFRRLRVTGGGRGVAAADGAEAATVALAGDDAIEVAIGGMRYRLPATTKAATAPE